MSMAARLSGNSGNVEVAAHSFAAYFALWVTGDWDTPTARTKFDELLTDNGYSVLSAAERTELVNIKDHFDTRANANAQQTFFLKIANYSIALQDGKLTEAEWENFLHTAG